jgi:hypothetical protein
MVERHSCITAMSGSTSRSSARNSAVFGQLRPMLNVITRRSRASGAPTSAPGESRRSMSAPPTTTPLTARRASTLKLRVASAAGTSTRSGVAAIQRGPKRTSVASHQESPSVLIAIRTATTNAAYATPLTSTRRRSDVQRRGASGRMPRRASRAAVCGSVACTTSVRCAAGLPGRGSHTLDTRAWGQSSKLPPTPSWSKVTPWRSSVPSPLKAVSLYMATTSGQSSKLFRTAIEKPALPPK